MAICGAKKRNGEACQKTPMIGKTRCRLHGGASKNGGAPTGNKNSAKHNIYSQFMTDDELEFVEHSPLDEIESELKLCKVQLKRALEAKQKQAERVAGGKDGLEIDSIQDENDAEGGSTKTTFKWRDYDAIIDKLIARIQSLTTQRHALKQQELDIKKTKLEIEKIERESGPDGDGEVVIRVVRVGKSNGDKSNTD